MFENGGPCYSVIADASSFFHCCRSFNEALCKQSSSVTPKVACEQPEKTCTRSLVSLYAPLPAPREEVGLTRLLRLEAITGLDRLLRQPMLKVRHAVHLSRRDASSTGQQPPIFGVRSGMSFNLSSSFKY
jgi:hypothetical protein